MNPNIEALVAPKLDGVLLVKSSRGLATQVQMLLMGEPLANLDLLPHADWLKMVRALVAGGTTVVSVLHETTIALQADNMVVMAQGKVTHHGASSDPRTRQALVDVFDQRIAIHLVQGQWVALMPTASTI